MPAKSFQKESKVHSPSTWNKYVLQKMDSAGGLKLL
jgi:hypothetical protein